MAANKRGSKADPPPWGGAGALKSTKRFFTESVLGEASNVRLACYGWPPLSSANGERLLDELCALARE